MKSIAIIAAIVSLMAAVPVMAQVGSDWTTGAQSYNVPEGGESAQMTMDRSFSEVDQDGDGMVTESELQQTYGDEATQNMSTMDQDGDGSLTQQEYESMAGGSGQAQQ